MSSPFKDDSYRYPNLALDGAIPRELRPWEEWVPPTPPAALPDPPSWPIPQMDELPWWVDPRSLPERWKLPLPGSSHGPDRHSRQSQPQQARPLAAGMPQFSNPFVAENHLIRSASAPIDRPGDLRGLFYEMMLQSARTPDAGSDAYPSDASQQAPPQRRLVRRTYRL